MVENNTNITTPENTIYSCIQAGKSNKKDEADLVFSHTSSKDIDPYNRLAKTWLIVGMLCSIGVSVLFGASQVGKSFLALFIAFAIRYQSLANVTGIKTIGAKKNGIILYFTSEDRDTLFERIRALSLRYLNGVPVEGIEILTVPITLDDPRAYNTFVNLIENLYGNMPIQLIVFDTLRGFLAGDENKQTDIHAYFSCCKLLSDKFGCCILSLVHEIKASNEQNDPFRKMAGSSAIRSDARDIIHLESRIKPDGTTILRALSVKTKNAIAEKAMFFSIETVKLPKALNAPEDATDDSEGVIVTTHCTNEEFNSFSFNPFGTHKVHVINREDEDDLETFWEACNAKGQLDSECISISKRELKDYLKDELGRTQANAENFLRSDTNRPMGKLLKKGLVSLAYQDRFKLTDAGLKEILARGYAKEETTKKDVMG